MRSEGGADAGEGSIGVVSIETTGSAGKVRISRTGSKSVQAGDEGAGGA